MVTLNNKLQERWGRKFIDQRDWSIANEKYVKQGEVYLDLDYVKNWDKELKKMNENKVGAPYIYPASLIQTQAMFHAKGFGFRQIEGITRKLVQISALPDYDDYTTIHKRVNQLDTSLPIPDGPIIALCDGTGFQVIEGGEYLRGKYGKKNRRWIQVIIWGDPETKKPVSFEVKIVQGSEIESGKNQLRTLLKNGLVITHAGGDGAFDSIPFWNFLDENNIRPLIKPDKNARTDSDSGLRNQVVKERNRLGHKRWSKKCGYGKRWPATEGIFSAVKRIFGEQIHAKSEKGMLQEAAIKFWAYSRLNA